jgi:serine/threonine protein kinase
MTESTTSLRVVEETPAYWRVVFDYPPFNMVDADDIRQRFEREARAISALNHPNICGLYDICEFEGVHFLVMEYVEGETLAARLRRGALPLEDVLEYGARIADALAAAHSHNIVHRDMKPANIMIAQAGVKLLDFGLAKTTNPRPSEDGALAATETAPLTASGTIIGTLAYMAPEHVEGRPCDPRTDIFALGLLLYEMSTGGRAFRGDNQASLIAAILRADPSPMHPPAPREFEHVVRRCLEKKPEERWQAASDVKRELEWVAGSRRTGEQPEPVAARPRRANWIWPVVAIVCVMIVSIVFFRRPATQPERPVAFTVVYDSPFGPESDSIPVPSPDGVYLAYMARDRSGKTGLWLRRLDSAEPRLLPETDDGSTPIWSADSRWIGFYAQGKLKKISPEGGRPQTIAEIPGFFAGTWNAAGDIVFAPVNRGPLFHLRESGGAPRQITQLDRSRLENSHRSPQFLPDGRQFLYLARCAERGNNALYLGTLDSAQTRRIERFQSNVEYVALNAGHSGALLFVSEGTLFAQPFDGWNVRGGRRAVLEGVEYLPSSAFALFAASADGRVVVYRPAISGRGQLLWFDRSGNVVGRVGPSAEYYQPRISPDGSRVAFNRPDNRLGNRDIWYIETVRGVAARLTVHQANDWFPVWSPDSKRLLFASDRAGGSGNGIYEKKSMDPGNEETAFLLDPHTDINPSDWSRDGSWILFCPFSTELRADIWLTQATGERKPFAFVATPADERFPRFSPNGKWIVYQSNETGRYEVYARPFAGGPAAPEGKIQLSDNGGEFPVWRADGQELFYLSRGIMYSVATRNLGQSGATPRPSRLFIACPDTQPVEQIGRASNPFDVGPDGRFLINCRTERPGQSRVLLNWLPAKIASAS